MSCEACSDPEACSSDFSQHTSSLNFLEHKIPSFEYRYGAVIEHSCGPGQGIRVDQRFNSACHKRSSRPSKQKCLVTKLNSIIHFHVYIHLLHRNAC